MEFSYVPEQAQEDTQVLVKKVPENKLPPRLETPETAYLREQYPPIEYLEAGHIADWLKVRKDQLLVFADQERVGTIISKSAGLVGMVAGFLFHATSPMAPIGGLLSAFGYAWAQIRDSQHTHTFSPIPFIRGNVLDFAGSMGHVHEREKYFKEYDEFEQLKLYLPPCEREEYTMLRQHLHTLTDYLDQVEPMKRFHAYGWLCDCFIQLKGSFPTVEQVHTHMNKVEISPLINHEHLAAIKAMSEPKVVEEAKLSLAAPTTKQLPNPKIEVLTESKESVNTQAINPEIVLDSKAPDSKSSDATSQLHTQPKPETTAPKSNQPDLEKLKSLPLQERAMAVIDLLDKSGFDIGKAIRKQVTVICGNQRGGKGTLMGILSILSAALKPGLKVHYFSAGDDIYPFKCDRLVCAATYRFASEPDALVASGLETYLREMERAPNGSLTDTIFVLDEAVALAEYQQENTLTWMVKFLLTRAAKKGARIFIVLHGNNLTSWVGTGRTGGMAPTFKQSASFIGCESTSIKISPLETIDVATGRYFITDPEEFGVAVPGGEIGTLPDWIKTEKNPVTGQPDPVRTLLKIFPELHAELSQNLGYEENLQDKVVITSSASTITTNKVTAPSTKSASTNPVTVTQVQKQKTQTAVESAPVATTTLQYYDVEEVEETELQDAPSRENDFMFLMAMAQVAKQHIVENEWVDFDVDKLRKINRFIEPGNAGRHLNRHESRAVAKILDMQKAISIIDDNNYRANLY